MTRVRKADSSQRKTNCTPPVGDGPGKTGYGPHKREAQRPKEMGAGLEHPLPAGPVPTLSQGRAETYPRVWCTTHTHTHTALQTIQKLALVSKCVTQKPSR